MKKYLITGLVILLPLALTIILVTFIFNLLTAPFVDFAEDILNYFGLFSSGFLFFTAHEMKLAISKLMILVFLFFFTVTLGALARWYLIRYLLKVWDFILHRIPFVSTIYKVSQDVIKTIFASDTNSFKQVVMVPFPHADSYSLGLVTRDDLPALHDPNGPPLIAVFVPTTPNPTSGFLITYEEKDLIYLDIKIEDAFKCILSCGVLLPAFNRVSKEEALALLEKNKTRNPLAELTGIKEGL
ncbi:MAG: DUF502 domain-containing protein [Parachlamydiaceae bacterium]|nr:DUF502 domain-containing protein [Parachlamydiaceae bacterium]